MSKVRKVFDHGFHFFASLKLTLFCLGMLMVLVFLCSLDQVHLGTFGAVKKYMRHFFLYWQPPGTDRHLPVFPGGALIGFLLLLNLLTSHYSRFRLTGRKAGLWLIHFGLIALVAGEFVTGAFQVESQLIIKEGGSKNYSENPNETEIVVVDTDAALEDEITSIPESLFKKKKKFETSHLPFAVSMEKYYANSVLLSAAQGKSEFNILANRGFGPNFLAQKRPPVTKDDEVNTVSAYVSLLAKDGSNLGTWLLSSAISDYQPFVYKDKTYFLALRPKRYYFEYWITLKDFRHDLYPGTEIPKNFSSLIHLKNPKTGEARDVLIYMNNPLRYDGKAFYQSSFGENDTVSVLAVVKNPGWTLPYIAFALVGVGLLIHFIIHFVSLERIGI